MIKTSTFQIQAVCPGCNSYHALSGIKEKDTCQNCGKIIDTSEILHERMFGMMDKAHYMNGFLSGSMEQIGGGAYKLVYSSMPPYCENCRQRVNEAQLEDAFRSEKPFTCTGCGHTMPVRKADGVIKAFHSGALGIINDSLGTDYGSKEPEGSFMLVFKCMTCGAGLELTSETERTIKCKYCDNENYLPDAVWTKLHPDKEPQPLFVILDVTEDELKNSVDYFTRVTAVKVYSKHFENFIREYFERPFITGAFLCWLKYFLSAKNDETGFNMDITKLQKYFYDNLMLGLDTHPEELRISAAGHGVSLPAELQSMLAADKSEKVRLALAGNRNIKKDIIKKLRSDISPEVSAKAKEHKSSFMSRLFG